MAAEVISTCYVKVIDLVGIVTVEPVIYLSPQMPEGKSETFQEFSNPFDAKKYILGHVMPDTYVEVAA